VADKAWPISDVTGAAIVDSGRAASFRAIRMASEGSACAMPLSVLVPYNGHMYDGYSASMPILWRALRCSSSSSVASGLNPTAGMR
jgi:hypothetical protein